MLHNVSYNDPKIQSLIKKELGAYTFLERISKKGTGSKRMTIVRSSLEISSLLELDHNTNVCSIEIKPKGILLRFRSLLETFALVIPFYRLSLFKSGEGEYSIFSGEHKVTIMAEGNHTHDFMKKIIDCKTSFSQLQEL